MAAADFFLPEITGGDDRFVAPMRSGIKVEPFVDGQATFAAMELDAAKAATSVFVATWMFGHGGDKRVTLRAPKAVATALKARGITATPQDWVSLLGVLAQNGVDVRVILGDFDAIEAPANHEGAWRAHAEFLAEGARVQARTGTRRLHVITSLHPATVQTLLPIHTIDAELRPKLTRICTSIAGLKRADRQAALCKRPGIWPFIDVSATFVPTVQASPTWVMHPVSHHWKLLVIDAKVAYVGGLDLGTTRADTPLHDSLARRWHDVQVRVDGEVARDIARAFVGRWTPERAAFDAFVTTITAAHPRIGLTTQAPTAVLLAPPPAVPGAGSASAQLLRTFSVPAGTQVPNTIREDVRQSYEIGIGRATKYIYIENQYLRDTRIEGWIRSRAASDAQVVVIVVVPVAPEEVRPGVLIDPVTEHGMALQHGILTRLAADLGARFGVFSMVAKAAGGSPTRPTDSPVPPPGYRSRQIYVHSKVLIVDDEFAIVGSANANKRSFDVDSEICVAFHDAPTVTNFRLKLWGELLGNPTGMATWAPSTFLTQWNTIANANRAASTKAGRKGFVVPHNPALFPGSSHVWVHDAWAGLTEEDEGVALV